MDLWTRLWGRYHVPQNVFLVTTKVLFHSKWMVCFVLCFTRYWPDHAPFRNATINLLIEVEVSISAHYEDMKGGTKCRNGGDFGVISYTMPDRQSHKIMSSRMFQDYVGLPFCPEPVTCRPLDCLEPSGVFNRGIVRRYKEPNWAIVVSETKFSTCSMSLFIGFKWSTFRAIKQFLSIFLIKAAFSMHKIKNNRIIFDFQRSCHSLLASPDIICRISLKGYWL